MPEKVENQAGLEDKLLKLLDNSSAKGINQDNLLILLSLVNLRSIITIIEQRISAANGDKAENPIDDSQNKVSDFVPDSILNMLGVQKDFKVDENVTEGD